MVPARSSLRPIEAFKVMMVLPHAEALLVAIGKTGSRTGSKGAPPSNAATRFHCHPWGHDGHASEGNASANARKLALCERTASEKWHPTYLRTLTDLMSEIGQSRRFDRTTRLPVYPSK